MIWKRGSIEGPEDLRAKGFVKEGIGWVKHFENEEALKAYLLEELATEMPPRTEQEMEKARKQILDLKWSEPYLVPNLCQRRVTRRAR